MTAQLTRVAGVKAFVAGRDAARAGKPFTVCPFDANGGKAARWCTRQWLAGHTAGTRK